MTKRQGLFVAPTEGLHRTAAALFMHSLSLCFITASLQPSIPIHSPNAAQKPTIIAQQ